MDDYFQSFKRSETGTWTCVTAVTLHHPMGRIQVTPGTTFAPGTNFMGVDVAVWLDQEMRSNQGRRTA